VSRLLSGGETIREICRQSGAHVELNRDQSSASLERVFRIQGSSDQILQAIQLVSEKAGIVNLSIYSSSSSLPYVLLALILQECVQSVRVCFNKGNIKLNLFLKCRVLHRFLYTELNILLFLNILKEKMLPDSF